MGLEVVAGHRGECGREANDDVGVCRDDQIIHDLGKLALAALG